MNLESDMGLRTNFHLLLSWSRDANPALVTVKVKWNI